MSTTTNTVAKATAKVATKVSTKKTTKKPQTVAKPATFLEDFEEKAFISQEEFQKFLSERESTDAWHLVPTWQVKLDGLDAVEGCSPLFAEVAVSGIEGYEGTAEGAADVMSSGLSLIASYWDNTDERWHANPLGPTAEDSLFERAGIGGPLMRHSSRGACLSPSYKAEVLSYCLSQYKDKDVSTVLVRDGKIRTLRSDKYKVLSAVELLQATLDNLPEESQFRNGIVSQEITEANIFFGSEQADEEFKEKLVSLGIACQDVCRVAKFYTSDTGDTAAAISPYLLIDGTEYPLGSPLKMKHLSSASMDRWKEMLGSLSSMLKESDKVFEKLAKISIKNAASCLRYWACELGLSKINSLKYAQDEFEPAFPNGCTALDIYKGILAIVEKTEAASKGGVTIAARLKNRENVARLLGKQIDMADFKFEWAD